MLLGEIFQSIKSWQKLAAVNMKPKLAYQLLKYTKLVSAEHAIVEQQRLALIQEITGAKEGQNASVKSDTPEMEAFVPKYNEIMVTESDLRQTDVNFEEVLNAVEDKEEALSISDLMMLEPFFSSQNEVVPAGEPESK